jgi:hypothetical protein
VVVVIVKLMLVVSCGLLAKAGAVKLNVPIKAARTMHIVNSDLSFNRNQ